MIIENGKDIQELNLEDLNQVSGGGQLEELISRIINNGRSKELKNILQTQGKAAAAAKCCDYYGSYCGFCAAAVTML